MFNKDVLLWRFGCLCLLWVGAAAKHVSPNFEVEAPTESIARQVSETAEKARRELAVEWLGHELPNWSARCQVRVKVGQIGAGGATTFSFAEGEVFGWNMSVQGSLERILDSVIPHEVSHTIFACHFRRPLPRWADEGAATLAEESSECRRQQKLAEEVLPTNRRIPLRDLLTITEYPKNMQHVLTLYAEGYSLANYLVQQRGKRRFLTFVQDAHELGWEAALKKHYGEKGIDSLESKWSQWVIAGSPSLKGDVLLASAGDSRREAVRSQTPDGESSSSSLKADVSLNRAEQRPTNGGGHSVGTRGQQVSAPAPKRRSSETSNPLSNELLASVSQSDVTVLAASPFAMATDAVSSDTDWSGSEREGRRPRGSHLSPPEFRQSPESFSSASVRQSAGGSKSPVLTMGNGEPSLRRSPRQSSRPVISVQPVQERKSTFRFQPFPSR